MIEDLYPPDYGSDIGKVRLLIPDVELLDNPQDFSADPEYMFNDNQINGFISIGGGSVLRAAAYAVDAIATNEALTLLVIKTDDKATDGAKLSSALREKAKALHAQADAEDGATSFSLDYFSPWSGEMSWL